ncbi:hypothetical protein CAPTEDRAFT_135004, partial [Capitella teleta]
GTKRGILERLDDGEVIVGDGGFVWALEKRGYVKVGEWTPEACIENPEAVRQLHREFLRAGADTMQSFSFYASDDRLGKGENEADSKFTRINKAACNLAKEVATEGDCITIGGLTQTPTYLSGAGKKATQEQFRKQAEVLVNNNMDVLLCEYFERLEEIEWAIEVCKTFGKPIAATMCIGPDGDLMNNSTGDCAVRMVKAGADIIGINCKFDPFVCLEGMRKMKAGLDAAGLRAHLMVQPLAFLTPDANKHGYTDLPEFPFALEPRLVTRWDMHRFAREAYEMGIRYIGGCCGCEPYHIRAVAEELAKERGKLPKGSEKHDMWGQGLRMHTKTWVRARADRRYWEELRPSSGRPLSASMSKPDE